MSISPTPSCSLIVRAEEIDPDSSAIRNLHAHILFFIGRTRYEPGASEGDRRALSRPTISTNVSSIASNTPFPPTIDTGGKRCSTCCIYQAGIAIVRVCDIHLVPSKYTDNPDQAGQYLHPHSTGKSESINAHSSSVKPIRSLKASSKWKPYSRSAFARSGSGHSNILATGLFYCLNSHGPEHVLDRGKSSLKRHAPVGGDPGIGRFTFRRGISHHRKRRSRDIDLEAHATA